MQSRITAVLASMLLVVVVFAAPAHATFPGANGKIAYSSCSTEAGQADCGISIVNSDGSGSTKITHNTDLGPSGHGIQSNLVDGGASWSADGKKLAYISQRPDGDEIRVVNADGSGLTRLGVFTALWGLAWSPDGRKIAFATSGAGQPFTSQIFTMNSDGTGVTQLTAGPVAATAPDWSPDGTKIAFAREFFEGGSDQLYTMNPDGSGQAELTSPVPGNVQSFDPSWSPDGARIAFTHQADDTGYEIFSMKSDGSDQTDLTNSPAGQEGEDRDPVWSPDGTKIAFDRTGELPFGVFVMNSDGTDQHLLISGGGPAWQPIPEPQRGDYKNAAQFCKAERAFLGGPAFARKHSLKGNPADAFGRCVSRNR